MNPVQKALWFVESYSRVPITLEQVAQASNVSPYYLTRAFSTLFGISLMRYVRQRRLSEAAKQLASGAPDILSLALEFGYGSHEAFSRAFKEAFQWTPEQIRSQGHIDHLVLTEAFVLPTKPLPNLAKPRLANMQEKRLVGTIQRYASHAPAGIPDQWQRFQPFLNAMQAFIEPDAYGVCIACDKPDHFDYICGYEIEECSVIPEGLIEYRLPAQRYAVFAHKGHISEIRAVNKAIWSLGLPGAELHATPGPTLEKYGATFDPATGNGGYEIWVAVA